jgi:hypothetical protein
LWFVQIDFFTITYSAEVPMSTAIGGRQLLGFMMWFVPNSGVTVPEIEALFSEPQRGPNDIFLVTIRLKGGRRVVRPISARYMRAQEVASYEKKSRALNPTPLRSVSSVART